MCTTLTSIIPKLDYSLKGGEGQEIYSIGHLISLEHLLFFRKYYRSLADASFQGKYRLQFFSQGLKIPRVQYLIL